jgi:hypothetical protein
MKEDMSKIAAKKHKNHKKAFPFLRLLRLFAAIPLENAKF